MWVILVYRPELDPGQYEPRGVYPFAGIESYGPVYMEEAEAQRVVDRLRVKHPGWHFLIERLG